MVDAEGEPQVRELVNMGAEITGMAVAASAGLFLGGPAGAYLGAAVGPAVGAALRTAAKDIAARRLSTRERVRVGAVVAVAAQKIQANLDAGRQPRADWFRSPWPGEPTPEGAEISEGVLLAAQRQHEERKITLLGNLLGNLAFEPAIDRSYANMLIRYANELSYRQFCLLELCSPPTRDSYDLADKVGVGDGMGPQIAVLLELFDLCQRSMIQQAKVDQDGNRGDNEIMVTPFLISPRRVAIVTGPGGWLLTLAELSTAIPVADITATAALLS